MYRHFLFWGALVFLFFSISPAQAHNADQLPFLNVDRQNAKIYPVGSTSLTTLTLPQDIGPGVYLINKLITFSLIPANLPIQSDAIAKTTFSWDFGDGSTATGSEVSHTYTKIGSHEVYLRSSSQEEGIPAQILDVVLLNILPSSTYVLPQANITANNAQPSNPYTDILKLNLHSPIQFSSTASTAPAGIATILWDMGDQSSASIAVAYHSYDSLLKYVLPMVRITDKNGFFSDAFVQIEDDPSKSGFITPTPATKSSASSGIKTVVASMLILVIGSTIAAVFRRQTKNSRSN